MKLLKKSIKIMLILVIGSAIAFGGYYFSSSVARDSTPWNLKPGIYIGQVPATILASDDKNKPEKLQLILDYTNPPHLVLIMEGERVLPLVADLTAFEKGGAAEGKLVLKVKKSRLEFESPSVSTIDLGSYRRYTGRVKNLETGVAVDWQVEAADSPALTSPDINATEFLRWYGYISEIDQVLTSVKASNVSSQQRDQEVKELQQLITNRDQLESYADQRLGELRQDLVKYQAELKEQTKLQEQLIAEMQAAQSLSQKGRLVSLTRELMQRETDLLRLKQGGDSLASKYDPVLLKRGARIRKLLDELSVEQTRLNELSALP